MDPRSCVSLDLSREYVGKQILSLFAVDLLSGASLDLSWEFLGEQILYFFALDPLSGAPLRSHVHALTLHVACQCV